MCSFEFIYVEFFKFDDVQELSKYWTSVIQTIYWQRIPSGSVMSL